MDKTLLTTLFIITILIQLNIVIAKDWWEGGNFYQIYPRSFKDSDNDGIGDLNGITSKLEYLKDIGMTGIWLSPIFQSPMIDFGYDISDYRAIQSEYGTMEDFMRLKAKCKELGIKLILDFVPNHTSVEHEWFKKSVDRDPEYENYYIWHDGYKNSTDGTPIPPNNWISVFLNSAWQWNEKRQQFYLHQFIKQQPDLNYREPKVVDEMKNILRFWMDKGVDGFRIDAVPFLFEINANENGVYPDEPPSGDCNIVNDPCYLDHIYTRNIDDTFDMVYQWRDVLDEYKKKHGGESKIIMTEAYTSIDNNMRLYGDAYHNGSHIPFNFELINNLNKYSKAIDYKNIIDLWLTKMPNNVEANWVLGNHDQKRTASRFGEKRADLLNILLQTLPGVAITYNGEEIAMTDVYVPWKETVDPQACLTNEKEFHTFSRDPARTPFQWDSTKNSGFSMADKTWLPVADDYELRNVQAQENPNVPSHLNIFKTLTALRRHTNTMLYGNYKSIAINDDILMYLRELPNDYTFIVVLNFGRDEYTIDVNQYFKQIEGDLKIVTTSVHSGYSNGDVVKSNGVIAYPEVGTLIVAL